MNYKQVYRQTIKDAQYIMQFGRYKGQTIEFLLENCPWYIRWLADNTNIDFDHTIMDIADGRRDDELYDMCNGEVAVEY